MNPETQKGRKSAEKLLSGRNGGRMFVSESGVGLLQWQMGTRLNSRDIRAGEPQRSQRIKRL